MFYRHCVRNVGFRSKRVFHCESVSHSEFLPYSEHVLRVVNGARALVFIGSWKLRWCWCSRWTWSCLHFKGAARSLLCAEHSISCFSAHCVLWHCVRNMGFHSKRVFYCEAVSHSEFLPYSEHVLRVVNGSRTLVFIGSWKLRWSWCSRSTWCCLNFKGAARSLLCAEHSISCFFTLCFIDTVWEMWDFVRSGFSIVKQFHILSFFPIANMYFVL